MKPDSNKILTKNKFNPQHIQKRTVTAEKKHFKEMKHIEIAFSK